MRLKIIIIFATLWSSLAATNYYVTQSGAATPLSTSPGSPSSVATFNSSTLPTAGDTVFFSGAISTTITPQKSGTGNGSGRITLDFSATVFNVSAAHTLIMPGGRNYVTYLGAGVWTQGSSGIDSVFHPGQTTNVNNNGCLFFDFNQTPTHDVTIDGFQSIGDTTTGLGGCVSGVGANTILISNCNFDRCQNLFFADGVGTHDVIIRGCYARTSANTIDQTDLVVLGDGNNMTVEFCKLIMTAPGSNSLAGPGGKRHNDIMQWYKGGGSSGTGQPYGIIIRYNWLEQAVVDSALGDGSITFTQIEQCVDGSAGFAFKIYGNVIYANCQSDANSNGGFGGGDSNSHTVYYYHNTYLQRHGANGGGWGWNGVGSLYFRNNVFWAASSFFDNSSVALSAGATWNRNFFFNWQSPSSTLAGPNGSRTTNPLFTNASVDDYSLSPSSTLRSAGDNTIGSEYSQGIAFGSTWPNPTLVSRGTSWDIGAYQYSAGGSDTTAPVITITAPTSSPTYSTSTTPLTSLAGTASDDVALSSVTWSNDRGGSGTATGTTSWSVASITLQNGANVITVTATDTSSNTSTDTLTVTYTPPSASVPTNYRKARTLVGGAL